MLGAQSYTTSHVRPGCRDRVTDAECVRSSRSLSGIALTHFLATFLRYSSTAEGVRVPLVALPTRLIFSHAGVSFAWIGLLIFDTAIFLLTLTRGLTFGRRASRPALARTLVRDGTSHPSRPAVHALFMLRQVLCIMGDTVCCTYC